MDQSDKDIFVAELTRHQNIVHKVCRLYTHSPDEHNDLFQEISIQLWKAFPKFRGEAKLTTWMYRIALNTAITLYRKSRRSIATTNLEDVVFRVSDQTQDDGSSEQIRLLYGAIKQLNDVDKALIFLYLEDKDYREISETLGITEVNARVRMNRIKTKLKTILNP